MRTIPRDTSIDGTLALLRDPYGFISERCRRYGADIFRTRIMLRPAICMSGPEAAALFYDERRFLRRGATPTRIQKTLFGKGGVQGLDGDAHRHRKQMFMTLMTPECVAELGESSDQWWRRYARRWATMDRAVLYDETREILTRSVCEWAGVPLDDSDVGRRTRELTALFDTAGAVGPKYWQGRVARRVAERWIAGVIGDIRTGRVEAPKASAAGVIATFRDSDGALLQPRIASVELLNVLRPTVAVSVFVVFVAHALHQHPGWRERLAAGSDHDAELFVQEVRRFYPFFPAVAARVAQDFEWKGYRLRGGTLTLLDLYGTDHDARTWEAPEEFRPERSEQWHGDPFTFVPQGGGDHHRQHRCPGEWITIQLMKVALHFLVGSLRYKVPEQDMQIDRSRLPALPRSRFILSDIKLAGPRAGTT